MTDSFTDALLGHITKVYGKGVVPLHRPVFEGKERQYVLECIDSNFVSSVGEKVAEFEQCVADYVGAEYGVATTNGTASLHAALVLAGTKPGDQVITQALTFVATANAILYAGAEPVFLDVDADTMGLSPDALSRWLEQNTAVSGGVCFNRKTEARISACIPMHTFGLPGRISEIVEICSRFGIPVIEDAAEALGSHIAGKHIGLCGLMATHSFNGNKVITTGGGGMITTNDEALAKRAKHLTTTAKTPHPWEYFHDEIGFNYRMPNLNAALGVAQMEMLPRMLEIKAEVAEGYNALCARHEVSFVDGRPETEPNYWLNAIQLDSKETRDAFLKQANTQQIMCRPVWRLMTDLPMFSNSPCDDLNVSRRLSDCVVNLPSSVPDSELHRLTT